MSVQNKHGEVNANLNLNVQESPVIVDEPTVKKGTKKKSIILEASVASKDAVDVEWVKEGQKIEHQRAKVTRKTSATNQGETIVQLEIEAAGAGDVGDYQLVAKSGKTEIKSRKISLNEETIKMPPAEKVEDAPAEAEAALQPEVTEVKKKKKKVVKKKKKKKEEEEPLVAPEVVSFLRNLVRTKLNAMASLNIFGLFQIKIEGENIELQCRLDEEMEEGKGTVTWFFNDEVLAMEGKENLMLSFDGTYAKLFIAK